MPESPQKQPQKLDVSDRDLVLIEAALQTQAKILRMQASAGGKVARQRLAENKRLIERIEQHQPARPCTARPFLCWLRLDWIFGRDRAPSA